MQVECTLVALTLRLHFPRAKAHGVGRDDERIGSRQSRHGCLERGFRGEGRAPPPGLSRATADHGPSYPPPRGWLDDQLVERGLTARVLAQLSG